MLVGKLGALQQVVVVCRKECQPGGGPLRDFLEVGGGWAEVGNVPMGVLVCTPILSLLSFQKPDQQGGLRVRSRRAAALRKVPRGGKGQAVADGKAGELWWEPGLE